MVNNDWERLAEEISRNVQRAVDERDFSRLNQTISDMAEQTLDNFSRGIRNGGWYRENPFARQRERENMQYTQPVQKKKQELLYMKGTSTKIGGTFLAATGYGVGTGMLAIALVTAVIGSGAAVTGALAACAVGFFGMGIFGTGMVSSVGRFRKYVKIIRDREYCDVSELAQRTGRSAKSVVKDIRKMIQNGWFRQGKLDEKESCLMVTDQAWQQYENLMAHMKQEKEEAEKAAKDKYDQLSPEVQKIVNEGALYVRKIREANDAIPGEEISGKIYRLEIVVGRIFSRVEKNPDSVDEIRRLMEYYLPTTVKLLDAYVELDAQPVQGENILSSKKEIEATLDTLNTAFEKLLDDLFQDTAWDVSSDISVLHMMLAQEGLTDDGLKKKQEAK